MKRHEDRHHCRLYPEGHRFSDYSRWNNGKPLVKCDCGWVDETRSETTPEGGDLRDRVNEPQMIDALPTRSYPDPKTTSKLIPEIPCNCGRVFCRECAILADEIEVTEEMIEAGGRALVEYDPYFDRPDDAAKIVFSEMLKAANPAPQSASQPPRWPS